MCWSAICVHSTHGRGARILVSAAIETEQEAGEECERPTKWSDSTRTCATNNNKRGGQLGPLYLEGGFPGGDCHPRAHQHLSRRGKKVSAPQQSDRASPFSSRRMHLTNYNDRVCSACIGFPQWSHAITSRSICNFASPCSQLDRTHREKLVTLTFASRFSDIFQRALDFVWFHFHGSYRARGEFKASNL